MQGLQPGKGILSAREETSVKQPYVPPAVLWEETIEQGAMLAAACGKNESRPGSQCESAPAS